MKTQPASDIARSRRSEAFPEDLADLVESSIEIAAARRHRPSGSSKVWLLALLPVGAVTFGTALAMVQRLF